MQIIETAWKEFFKQFVLYVYTESEWVDDPDNILYPRITFSYSIGDFFDVTATTFQIWTWSHNNSELWSICDKITKAVPVESGTSLDIAGESYFEYKNPITDKWVQFEIEELQEVADEFAPTAVKWREIKSSSAGGIEIRRGNPFLTPSPKDKDMSRVMYGVLKTRYLNVI